VDFSAGIDEAQAEELLRQDAVIVERAILRLINVPMASSMHWYPSPIISAVEYLINGRDNCCRVLLRLSWRPF